MDTWREDGGRSVGQGPDLVERPPKGRLGCRGHPPGTTLGATPWYEHRDHDARGDPVEKAQRGGEAEAEPVALGVLEGRSR